MKFTKEMVTAMGKLPLFRFIAIWIWLLTLAASPLVFATAKLVEALR
ncbi:MAG: hypothetical protein ACRYG5_06600 [Janthinobacterium lividum]